MNRYRAVLCVLGITVVFWPARADDKARLKPTNLAPVNTTADESDSHLASTGLILYVTRTVKGHSGVLISMRRNVKAAWTAPRPFPDLQGKADYQGVFVTPEGRFPQNMYFSTNKDPLKNNRGDNYDLYFYIRQFPNADFTTATALRVCTERDEMHPWLTADGTTLFFSRKVKEGWQLFVTRRPPDGGQFGDDQSVGLPLGFHHATLTPNGKTMYVQGPLEKDRWGLFRCTLTGKKWSKPEPLTELNDAEAAKGDLAPSLSRDGSILFFSSDRAGGKGGLDIWSIPTKELMKNEK